jgi:predicted RNase H-like HicB family nuclease
MVMRLPALSSEPGAETAMHEEQTLRIEIERLDHGYQAHVPSVDGLSSVGLTENETLKRLSDAAAQHFQVASIRLEVFRT